MNKKKYTVNKKQTDFNNFTNDEIWKDVNDIMLGHDSYLWMENGYQPLIIVKLFHTEDYIYCYFKVFEKKIKIKHTAFGSDVWKDSCVEFFINPFPDISKKYFNIEINAIGVPLIGVGENGNNSERYYFSEKEVKDWEIVPSIEKPIDGKHGSDFWTLHYKIPKRFFEKFYGQEFNTNKGLANFYKCGDETEYPHFGAWNRIENPEPNFHLPEYFGEISFSSVLNEKE